MGGDKSNDLVFSDIQGYSDEELLTELGERFDHWCFIGVRRNYDENGDDFSRYWGGDEDMCYALAGNLQKFINEYEEEEEEDDD